MFKKDKYTVQLASRKIHCQLQLLAVHRKQAGIHFNRREKTLIEYTTSK